MSIMKKINLLACSFLLFSSVFSQMNDCSDPIVNGCSSSNFVFSSVGDDYDDFQWGTIAAGCLYSGDNQLVYLVLTANTTGLLEWSVQGDGNTGYMDWAIWPYDPNTTCAGLGAGTLAPIACCWNAQSQGYAGMLNSANIPVGINSGNFQPPIMLTAGQQVLLGISNYSGTLDGQNITLTFFDEELISCAPMTPDQTICLGDTATVNIQTPGINNPSFTWLVTDGVSNVSSGTNVLVSPTVTTNYQVQVHQDANGNEFAVDTIIDFTITVNPIPEPNAGSDLSVCLGSPFTLEGSIADSSNQLFWTSMLGAIYGSGPTSISYVPGNNVSSPIISVNNAGEYMFILQEGNSACSMTDTCVVVVQDLSLITTPLNPQCYGGTDGKIFVVSNYGTEYSIDNGNTWQTTTVFNNLTAGTYTICTRSTAGCQVCQNVIISNPPEISLTVSSDTVICQNGTAALTASAVGGGSFVYHWDMVSDNSNLQLVTPSSNTIYSVYAENELGCLSSIESIQVTIAPNLIGTISPSITICPNNSATISASATGGIGGPYTFIWNSFQIENGNNSNLTVEPNASTNYSVIISDQCESTPLILGVNVEVSLPIQPNFSIVENDLCEPAQFHLINTSNAENIAEIIWNISNGSIYNTQDIETPLLEAGNYSVQMIITSQFDCIDSITVVDTLHVLKKPTAGTNYSPFPINLLNTTVDFFNTSENSSTYQWIFEEGNPAYSFDENPTVHFPDLDTGSYDVILIAISESGCMDTSSLTLVIESDIALYAPNAFTPDGDIFNNTWRVFAQGIDTSAFELYIYNRWGEKIWETTEINYPWDGTYLSKPVPDGMYTWTILTRDSEDDRRYFFSGYIQLIR